MPDNSKRTPDSAASPHKGYYLGEVLQETNQGRLLVEVIAKPDGTALSLNQALIEVLNNQLTIIKVLKERL